MALWGVQSRVFAARCSTGSTLEGIGFVALLMQQVVAISGSGSFSGDQRIGSFSGDQRIATGLIIDCTEPWYLFWPSTNMNS